MASILPLLQALPALLGLVKELVDWIKQMQATQKEKSLEDYFNKMALVIREVKLAKTDVEKRAAAVKLRDILGGI